MCPRPGTILNITATMSLALPSAVCVAPRTQSHRSQRSASFGRRCPQYGHGILSAALDSGGAAGASVYSTFILTEAHKWDGIRQAKRESAEEDHELRVRAAFRKVPICCAQRLRSESLLRRFSRRSNAAKTGDEVWLAVLTVCSPPLVGQAFAIPTGRSPSQFARPGLLLLPRDARLCFPIPRSSFVAFEIH